MFLKSTQQFGSFESITIRNQDNSFLLKLIPELGANIVDLKISGISLLDGVADGKELIQNDAYKSVFLAPFPNRIKDGKYEFNQESYQLPTNEEPRNNALHGLIFKSPFSLVSEKLGSSFAELILENTYNASEPGFPFRFKTTLNLLLSEKDHFKCTMSFENLEEQNIPFGYGWHPYFSFGQKVKELELSIPPVSKFSVDQQMIPTGEPKQYDHFSSPTTINDVQLDDCFRIEKIGEICTTSLKTKNSVIKLWQETGEKKLNYIQIYIPPHGDSIAIEPQTCCIDAFNNGYGYFELSPKEHLSASFGVEVQSI